MMNKEVIVRTIGERVKLGVRESTHPPTRGVGKHRLHTTHPPTHIHERKHPTQATTPSEPKWDMTKNDGPTNGVDPSTYYGKLSPQDLAEGRTHYPRYPFGEPSAAKRHAAVFGTNEILTGSSLRALRTPEEIAAGRYYPRGPLSENVARRDALLAASENDSQLNHSVPIVEPALQDRQVLDTKPYIGKRRAPHRKPGRHTMPSGRK